ncbi:MAG: pyridoxamine 5'-phosphate oxidase family protein [Hyphomicrobiales bacterium]|nr:pyridoxamine 5'-phosphate oxidase family protein [Hyphomicrobiales bacterium]
MDEAELRAEIVAFLDAHTVMSLATASAAGVHAASLMYARDGFALYWVSDPDSRHSRELEENPRVAATIAPDYDDFKEIRGLQIHGRARRLKSPAARAKAIAKLTMRYSFLKQFFSGPADLVRQMRNAVPYRLDPEHITLIDNSKGFGHRDVLVLDERNR